MDNLDKVWCHGLAKLLLGQLSLWWLHVGTLSVQGKPSKTSLESISI